MVSNVQVVAHRKVGLHDQDIPSRVLVAPAQRFLYVFGNLQRSEGIPYIRFHHTRCNRLSGGVESYQSLLGRVTYSGR